MSRELLLQLRSRLRRVADKKKPSDAEDLLYACIRPSLGSKEFFLRKAIGWALRQYAWTNPDEVRRYVREHESEMSSLSIREALKNLVERNVR